MKLTIKKSTRIFVLTVKKAKEILVVSRLVKTLYFFPGQPSYSWYIFVNKKRNQKNNNETRLGNDLFKDNDRGRGYPKWTGSHVWHVRTGRFPTHGDGPKHW